MLEGAPKQRLIDGFVFVPIDISGRRDRRPVDFGMAVLQLIRQPPRRFGDDL